MDKILLNMLKEVLDSYYISKDLKNKGLIRLRDGYWMSLDRIPDICTCVGICERLQELGVKYGLCSFFIGYETFMIKFYLDLFQKFPKDNFDGYRWDEEDIDSRIEFLVKYLKELET